jgi:hypothetical protein
MTQLAWENAVGSGGKITLTARDNRYRYLVQQWHDKLWRGGRFDGAVSDISQPFRTSDEARIWCEERSDR